MALMELMVETGWDAIDIQTLCDRANIGRTTFYQHYANKEELLKASFLGLRESLAARPSGACVQPGGLHFVGGMLAHVHEAQEVFRALLDRRSGHYVQERFRELLVEMVQSELVAGNATAWQEAAKANFLGGALFQLLVWWLGHSRGHQPHEIEAMFRHWSAPVIASDSIEAGVNPLQT